MNPLAERIEAYLLTQRRWVSGDDISAVFGIDKRHLRAKAKKKGLIGAFTISNTSKGFKHLRWASYDEMRHAYGQRRQHGIGELIGAREMMRNWKKEQQGQGLLF